MAASLQTKLARGSKGEECAKIPPYLLPTEVACSKNTAHKGLLRDGGLPDTVPPKKLILTCPWPTGVWPWWMQQSRWGPLHAHLEPSRSLSATWIPTWWLLKLVKNNCKHWCALNRMSVLSVQILRMLSAVIQHVSPPFRCACRRW